MTLELNPSGGANVVYAIAGIIAVFGLFVLIVPLLEGDINGTLISLGVFFLLMAFYVYGMVKQVPKKSVFGTSLLNPALSTT